MLHWLQDLTASSGGSTTPTVASALTLLAVVGKGVFDHRKGKHRDKSGSSQLTDIKESLTTLSGELRDLKAHVIGPDGENGLRGDVREIKAEVKGILERERTRGADRIHGEYRP